MQDQSGFNLLEIYEELELTPLNIQWPKKIATPDSKEKYRADHSNISPCSVRNMYGKSDLSQFEMFIGGWINYGLWKNIDYSNSNLLTTEDRIRSSENLYRHVLNKLPIHLDHTILEVGCGQGLGCILAMKSFNPKMVIGLDITPEQIERARLLNETDIKKLGNRLNFVCGAAEKMPFPDKSFSHIISIESAQHFRPIEKFISESYRLLNSNGTLIFTIFLAKNDHYLEKLKTVIPDADIHICDKSLPKIEECLLNSPFKNLSIESIGQWVWEGLDQWLVRQNLSSQWSRIWSKAYQKGFIDYYIIRVNINE